MKQYIRIALIATILSLVLIYVTAAKKSNNKRVSGGTGFDYDNQFPHLVSLQYSRDGRKYQHFCGGSIISSTWVVTAGHCLAEDGMDISKMRILAGVVKQDIDCSQASSNCVIRTVKRKIVHPNYNSQYIRNDIALIELSSALPLGAASQNKVQSIGIEGGTIPFRTVVTLTGWGRTLDSSNDLPSLAQKAFLPLQQPDVCNRQGLGMEGPYQLCAGEGRGINSCQGDSGGPLHWIRQNGNVNTMGLIGLVSYGPQGCGKQNAFGVYTNTTYWINYVKNYVPDLKVVNYMSADGGNTPTPTPTPTPNPSPCTCAQTVTTTETQTQSTVNEPSNRDQSSQPSMEQRHIELPKVINIEKKQ